MRHAGHAPQKGLRIATHKAHAPAEQQAATSDEGSGTATGALWWYSPTGARVTRHLTHAVRSVRCEGDWLVGHWPLRHRSVRVAVRSGVGLRGANASDSQLTGRRWCGRRGVGAVGRGSEEGEAEAPDTRFVLFVRESRAWWSQLPDQERWLVRAEAWSDGVASLVVPSASSVRQQKCSPETRPDYPFPQNWYSCLQSQV